MNVIKYGVYKENEEPDLLEFLKYILGCTYISDLRFKPYNEKAKFTLRQLDLRKYSLKQLKNVYKYIYDN